MAKNLLKNLLSFTKKLVVLFLISSIALTIVYRFVPVYFTPLMAIRRIENIFQSDNKGKSQLSIKKKWIPLKSISKNMIKAVIRAEDYKFYDHFGFDFEAINKAIEYNKKHKTKKGASTISQQTAKNVFLWPSRNYVRKGLEVYFTLLIELLWSKERILEVYLNIIELGPEIYGVEASAQKFFKKPASKLSRSEAALMAAVLPNPLKFKIDRPSSFVLKRQKKILGQGIIPKIVEIKNQGDPGEEQYKNVEETKKSEEFFDIKFQEGQDDEDKDKGPEETSALPAGPEVEN